MKVLRSLLALVVLSVSFTLFAQPVSAKDTWVQVTSKNFFLIGNASEKEIRKVATRLEQFRETFRQLFRTANLTSPIPTNVVVFKSKASFKNFKPKRADGKIDDFVAGYFQPGEDVNYIALSTEGEDAEVFGTIFHEYVHFIVETNFGKSDIPAWFNEGLAEYYQTFEIIEDQKVKLGMPQAGHLYLLRENKLMPLDQLFNVSNYQLTESGNHSRSIFYAQSWALMHYLLQAGDKQGLGKFLNGLSSGSKPQEAFYKAFLVTYEQMERELSNYVRQSKYSYAQVTFKDKLVFDAQMQVAPLSEAASNAYLGDLLAHTRRFDDAEPFLQTALRLEPGHNMATTALGMVKLRQRKYDEARTLLEKAVATDSRNHIALYRYAYLLSREGMDEFGRVMGFNEATTARMRDALKKAIAANPAFTESYELLAFVNLVNGDQLDESVTLLKTALRYQPGNQRYALRIAEILVRQDKFNDAATIADKIAATTDDGEMRGRAQSLVSEIKYRKQFAERQASSGSGLGGSLRMIGQNEVAPTEAELARREAEANLLSMNEALRTLLEGEQRVIGNIQRINCSGRPIVYTVKSGSETFMLTSPDFQGLSLNTFDAKASSLEVGCDEDLSKQLSVLTYRAAAGAKSGPRGELISIEFVPASFRLLTEEELAAARSSIHTGSGGDDIDRDGMMAALRSSLPKPGSGEKRQMGFLERIECTSKGSFFHLRTAGGTLRLVTPPPGSLSITIYARELDGIQFGCELKPVEFPAVFVYRDNPDPKAKTDGELTSIGFVPKSFTLE